MEVTILSYDEPQDTLETGQDGDLLWLESYSSVYDESVSISLNRDAAAVLRDRLTRFIDGDAP